MELRQMDQLGGPTSSLPMTLQGSDGSVDIVSDLSSRTLSIMRTLVLKEQPLPVRICRGSLRALKHALQFSGKLGPVTIYYDCMYASDTAQAQCEAKANVSIAKIAAGLSLLLAQFGPLHWTHEKGHHGSPWDEFADVAAKWAC